MSVQTRADRIWNRVIAGFAGAVVLTLAITGLVVLGGVGTRSYSQATPDDVVKSAVLMVKNGDARLLPDLIYADNEDMRGSLKRLGVLLGHMQKLADAIRKKFPDDIERYRKDAEEAIAKGKPPAALAGLIEQFSGRDGPPTADQEDAIRDIIARIFADPYAWIEQNEERLSTVEVTDDLASIMVDGKPAAGVGLTLKLDGDKWYLALPTNIPPVNRIMPKAPEQWRMINSLLKILDNTALELTDDVSQGRLTNLKAIGDKAQEKVIFPAGIWFAAYAADMDARGRIDRNMRQYRERQKTWAKSRADTPVGGVSDKVLNALSRIAAKEVEPQVRARKATRWADLSDRDFEVRVAEWIEKHKLSVDLAGTLSGDSIDAVVAQWEAGAGSELSKKTPK
jgi:hypothetical protein